MDMTEVQNLVQATAAQYFTGAHVIWANQLNTKPPLPYVTLKLGDVSRNLYTASDDDEHRRYWYSTVLDVNVYTDGKPMASQKGAIINYANTAQSDIMDFCNFVESEYITDKLNDNGLVIRFRPPVRNLTELEKERKYRYRAQAEFDIEFMVDASGEYGVGVDAARENYSGGGIADFAIELPAIESAEAEGGNR